MNPHRGIGITAASLGATAVMFGAFGAHALRGKIDETSMSIWHTATEYQFWHALALLILAAFANSPMRWWSRAAWTMAIGVVVFSATLYAIALGAPHWLGAITPFGGVLMIVGWVFVGVAFWCSASSK